MLILVAFGFWHARRVPTPPKILARAKTHGDAGHGLTTGSTRPGVRQAAPRDSGGPLHAM